MVTYSIFIAMIVTHGWLLNTVTKKTAAVLALVYFWYISGILQHYYAISKNTRAPMIGRLIQKKIHYDLCAVHNRLFCHFPTYGKIIIINNSSSILGF